MQAIKIGTGAMTYDWHGAGATLCALDAGGQDRLLTENTQLAERLRRLGPAMASMAAELAECRRELGALKRENVRLRALAGDRQVRAVLSRRGRGASGQASRGNRAGSTSSEPSRSSNSSRSVPWDRSTRSNSSP
jgi:hypothetical protein